MPDDQQTNRETECSILDTSDPGFHARYLRAMQILPRGMNAVDRKRAIATEVFPHESPDVALVCMEYRLNTSHPLCLQKPTTFAAKLNWLKFNDRRTLYGRLVDKAEARVVVRERWSANILIEEYGVYTDPVEIPWSNLPPRAVVKATHGWNMNHIVWETDPRPPTPSTIAELRSWLSVRHELRHAEWAYSLVPARLLVEAFLDEPVGGLADYKFFCFNGVPAFLKVDVGRSGSRTQGYLDLNWDPLPFRNPNVPPLERPPARPQCIEEMIDVARALSFGIPFVRVDLYEHNGCVRFGEFTLYPCGGNLWFEPIEWNEAIGGLLAFPDPTKRSTSTSSNCVTPAEEEGKQTL